MTMIRHNGHDYSLRHDPEYEAPAYELLDANGVRIGGVYHATKGHSGWMALLDGTPSEEWVADYPTATDAARAVLELHWRIAHEAVTVDIGWRGMLRLASIRGAYASAGRPVPSDGYLISRALKVALDERGLPDPVPAAELEIV